MAAELAPSGISDQIIAVIFPEQQRPKVNLEKQRAEVKPEQQIAEVKPEQLSAAELRSKIDGYAASIGNLNFLPHRLKVIAREAAIVALMLPEKDLQKKAGEIDALANGENFAGEEKKVRGGILAHHRNIRTALANIDSRSIVENKESANNILRQEIACRLASIGLAEASGYKPGNRMGIVNNWGFRAAHDLASQATVKFSPKPKQLVFIKA